MTDSREGDGDKPEWGDSNTIRVIENTFGVFKIPTEGIFCSQAGNVLFPTWEQSFSLNGNFDSSVVN